MPLTVLPVHPLNLKDVVPTVKEIIVELIPASSCSKFGPWVLRQRRIY
jgi:hypothetical protein